jgi:hypothetical protein
MIALAIQLLIALCVAAPCALSPRLIRYVPKEVVRTLCGVKFDPENVLCFGRRSLDFDQKGYGMHNGEKTGDRTFWAGEQSTIPRKESFLCL